MTDEAAVEGMRSLDCQELNGKSWFGNDMVVRRLSMPSLPIAPEYYVDGTEQDIGQGGAVPD